MEEYAKHSSHRRGHRRSSIGCCADLKKGNQSPYFQNTKFDVFDGRSHADGEELSECSTIISSLELSSSSFNSQEATRRPSLGLPFELEDDEEGETDLNVLKNAILHKYCTPFHSPSPSPKKEKMKVSSAMQQKLRFNGLEQAMEPTSQLSMEPKAAKPDRRKMMSRWASTGHMCTSDDECDPINKETRDKPPTSPVRRSPGKVAIDNSSMSPDNPRSFFRRRASTGVMGDTDDVVVQLNQEKMTFAPPESPNKNDKAPVCPDRRRQFLRRNSTGSSESLEDMLVCVDEQEKNDPSKPEKLRRKAKRKNEMKHRSMSMSALNYKKEDEDNNTFVEMTNTEKKLKKKPKKKPSKERKDKSKKKGKSSKSSTSSSSGGSTQGTNLKILSTKVPGAGMKNESLYSLMEKSASVRRFEAPMADSTPVARPARTFSRRASTGVLSGEGMVTTQEGNKKISTDAKIPRTSVLALRRMFERKS